ncbi:putative short-chain dehydrogenase [Mariannaea sp. PMI_226]|nr:putative short-chain dehydrogenase [Mariannaea sp. PMI_226]
MSDPFKPYAEHYVELKGPGDSRPTARQVIKDNDRVNQLIDTVALVTGGTSGIGFEITRALHATGADVFVTARNLQKAQAAVDDLRKSSESDGKIEVIEMDMNSLDSVKKAAKEFLSKSTKLNILVNNAGVMATPAGTKTDDGFEQQFGVNHLAHFTLTTLLLPTLLSSSTSSFNSRIVAVSSNGHRYSPPNWDDVNFTQNYDPWVAYGQSKTSNIWMTNYIDRVYGDRGLHANAVHPGGAVTSLQQHLPTEMLQQWGSDPAMGALMQAPEQAAATVVWGAVAKILEGKGGKYLCNCGVGDAATDVMSIFDPGYAPHAFDVEGENRLWELSSKLTGVVVEQ